MKLFVGNLPFTLTEDELRKVFEQAGEIVSLKIIFDQQTNRSRGFGFVEYADSDAAKQAIKEYNGFSINDRPIVVKEAINKESRDGSRPPRRPRQNNRY